MAACDYQYKTTSHLLSSAFKPSGPLTSTTHKSSTRYNLIIKKMHSLVLLLLLFCSTLSHAQNATDPTLLEILTPSNSIPPNEIASLIFPPAILSAETPIAIRYVLITLLPIYTINAACHPTALGFLGQKDPIPPSFCLPLPRAKIIAFIQNRLLRSQFPIEARPFQAFLLRNNLDALNTTTDPHTIIGWPNHVANPLIHFLETDGWNSRGDASRSHFRQQYSDSTRYRPQNRAALPESRLRRPLRWQPLTQEADRRGRFISQVHVAPHLGRTVKPLVLTEEDLRNRNVESPYETPDRKKSLGRKDERTMRRLIGELFEQSQNLTERKVALATWWDNKFFSLGTFIFYYQSVLGLFDEETGIRYAMGEVLAQHDAVLVAWKEKVRHDLVRPTTIIRRLLKGRMVRAFTSLTDGVQRVKAEEWEPVIKVQPHSEFPSASSVICKASTDQLKTALQEEIFGNNATIPAFQIELNEFLLPGFPLSKPLQVRFDTLDGATRSCGNSRLLAGVHFSPSVPAGFKLAQGIGRKAYEHMSDLWAGRVPTDCSRCGKHY